MSVIIVNWDYIVLWVEREKNEEKRVEPKTPMG